MPEDRVSGIVFNIQRFSIDDGPGIRTTVFLKGCPLKCPWCSNPESINPRPDLLFFEKDCLGCGSCLKVCPRDALRMGRRGKPVIERSLCDHCFRCAEICPSGGWKRIGSPMAVKEIVQEIEKDRPFFERSGGGVTLSGGEPTLQAEFARCLLETCKRSGLTAVLETCGGQQWELFSGIAREVDLVLYDLKIMDPQRHKAAVGTENRHILENARKLVRSNITEVFFRIPVVPGFTDSAENLGAISEFLVEIGCRNKVGLVPYHRFGEAKYAYLGRPYLLREARPLSREEMEKKAAIFRSKGLEVEVI